MACAWVTPASEDPPMVVAFVAKTAHTAKLIRETKQFGISIPGHELREAIWVVGSTSGRATDKFAKAGLKPRPAKKIAAPVIEGCLGYLECKLVKVVDAGECFGFVGRVEAAYVDSEAYKGGLWNPEKSPVLHLGGKQLVRFCL